MTKFGIEIEFAGRNKVEILRSLDDAGLSVLDRTHTHQGHDNEAWVLKRDGSLTSGGRHVGYELVSPPLSFEDERSAVVVAMIALKSAGCTPHPCAGIHIHCDATDLNPRQLSAVPRFVAKFEDLMFRLAAGPQGRVRSGAAEFARILDPEMVRKLYRVRKEQTLLNVWYGPGGFARSVLDGFADERYRMVNLHSWFLRGTVEFRLFNSTDDIIFVQAWIAMCRWIVEDARRGFVRSVGKSYPLGSMASGDVNAKALMLRFQQVLRYESGCPVEDWRFIRQAWKNSLPQTKDVALV